MSSQTVSSVASSAVKTGQTIVRTVFSFSSFDSERDRAANTSSGIQTSLTSYDKNLTQLNKILNAGIEETRGSLSNSLQLALQESIVPISRYLDGQEVFRGLDQSLINRAIEKFGALVAKAEDEVRTTGNIIEKHRKAHETSQRDLKSKWTVGSQYFHDVKQFFSTETKSVSIALTNYQAEQNKYRREAESKLQAIQNLRHELDRKASSNSFNDLNRGYKLRALELQQKNLTAEADLLSTYLSQLEVHSKSVHELSSGIDFRHKSFTSFEPRVQKVDTHWGSLDGRIRHLEAQNDQLLKSIRTIADEVNKTLSPPKMTKLNISVALLKLCQTVLIQAQDEAVEDEVARIKNPIIHLWAGDDDEDADEDEGDSLPPKIDAEKRKIEALLKNHSWRKHAPAIPAPVTTPSSPIIQSHPQTASLAGAVSGSASSGSASSGSASYSGTAPPATYSPAPPANAKVTYNADGSWSAIPSDAPFVVGSEPVPVTTKVPAPVTTKVPAPVTTKVPAPVSATTKIPYVG